MAKAKKFGTFGGVFVPSVLTILGVIMYLRLGWVVGNAGLVGTIIIILIAHVISISTGLSVSSIATDKKVKAGGIYYILSRSLGLPIGGAIGIALFVATALSIAMYIVGFGESLNHAIGISHLGMESAERINNLRITGSITLVAVTTIALVSTSLAIKAQYYILVAIGLSLISVVAGALFMDHGFAATNLQLFSGEGSVPMETVFAIFFPAVTGFTAGVAMSGDLKDPKKSIPVGTMAAIGVGLFVYLGLAIFLSTTIDPQYLREDTNILAKIALFSAYGAPFLMAGIWGATLSSALGGILGGPRILQAMSVDKVTPKLFGKGVGKSNEPRNALLFTFIIAEAGILIGELDLIAPIVSMFYLSAYGFINLTSALESWSGSDFRPTFKISRVFSIIGAIATFAVMFKLDMIAMFASFVVIGMIFLYLTKKQINLGFSDVWQGVWSEVVRTALFRMSQITPDKRSWRPNIILFSGSTDKRPHLVEYGKKLVGRLGLLSNFDIVEDPDSEVLFAKRDQAVGDLQNNKGVFTRQYSCPDIYSGIERIAQTYGFSGLDPNTVLIGWARYSKDPARFSALINKFKQLDYSLLIMDYDPRVGFGSKQCIDIWWEGQGRHVSFALTISRFLSASDDWKEATIRLFIIADTSQVDDVLIYRTLEQVQEEVRVQVQTRIINRALDHRTFYEIVKSESSQADLIYLELPELESGSEAEFFSKTDSLCQEIGTVILYRASGEFDSIDLGIGTRFLQPPVDFDMDTDSTAPVIHPLNLPQMPVMAENFKTLNASVERLIQGYVEEYIKPYAQKNFQLVQSIHQLTSDTYKNLAVPHPDDPNAFNTYLSEKEGELLDDILKLIKEFQTHELKAQEQSLMASVDYLWEESDEIIAKCTPRILVEYHTKGMDATRLKNFSWWQRVESKILNKPLRYHLDFQMLTTLLLKQQSSKAFLEIQQQINQDSDQLGSDLQKYIRRTAAGLRTLISNNGNIDHEKLTVERVEIERRFDELKNAVSSRIKAYGDYLLADSRMHLQELAKEADDLVINKGVRSRLKRGKYWKGLNTQLKETAAVWGFNQPLYFNIHQMEIRLLAAQNDLWQLVSRLSMAINQLPREKIIQKIEQLITYFRRLEAQLQTGKYPKLSISHELTDFSGLAEMVSDFNAECKQLTVQLPSQLQVPNTQNSGADHNEEVDVIEISPRDVVNYQLQTKLLAPLEEHYRHVQPVLSRVDNMLVDVIQVIKFSLDNIENEGDAEVVVNSANLVQAVKDEISRLEEGSSEVEELLNQITGGLNNNYQALSEELNAYAVIRSALDLDYYLRTQKQTQVINKFSVYSRNIKNYVQAGLTNLYYRRSEGLIAAKRYQNRKYDAGVWTDSITRFVKDIIPDQKVMEGLPFYYRQLFLRPHSVNKELWMVRDDDTLTARESINNYLRVKSGGLLVLGMPLSGKTYFSEFLASGFTETSQVYTVNAPDEGSVEVRVFHQAIKKAIKFYGDLEMAFEHLEEGSVMIFNDAELWWQRDESGFKVLDVLIDLIDRFGAKCLFIVNMNSFSFNLINNIKRIEDAFFKIAKIQPYNAEELKDLILLRHNTSRLKFELAGMHEDGISKWNQAKLFTRYFDASQGNAGVALQMWISNIKGVSQKREIQIQYPVQPDPEVLSHLDEDRAVILIQLILHRRATAGRLATVLKMPEPELEKKLQVLQRWDIIREKNGVWEINRYLKPYLISSFQEDRLI